MLDVLETPIEKKLTANCLVGTRKILEELIPAAMVEYVLYRVQLPFGCSNPSLTVSHGMVCLGQQWSANFCKAF